MVGISILGNRIPRGRTIKPLSQTGKKPNLKIDKSRNALVPGKRISSTGNVYWETRKNRSDKRGTKL